MARKWHVSVASHTHWDREWYQPFQQFRIRLVRLVDKLLDILENVPGYRCFNFDGQTVVLEDYLEVKPDQEERLGKCIAEGRLAVGPWYILPDEFLVSGEATIRNLIIGHKVARRFGRAARVGYLPDCFGHISQMPQILRGFGIDNAIVWRGTSRPPTEKKTAVYWQAPDGSKVLAYVFPDRHGYSIIHEFPRDPQEAVERVAEPLAYLKDHATTTALLLTNGSDHVVPQPWLPSVLRALNKHSKDTQFVHATYEEFIARLRKRPGRLATEVGELRRINRDPEAIYNYLLYGVFSARIYLKQQNEACQTLLERITEPLATIASLLGCRYETEILETAWKTLLKNHPHDNICGCSADAVHRDMEARFAAVEQIGTMLADEALAVIAKSVKRPEPGEDERPFIVFNPSPYARSDLVQVGLPAPVRRGGEMIRGVVVRDLRGRSIPCQIVGQGPPDGLGEQCELTVSFVAPRVPGLGHKAFTAELLSRPVHSKDSLIVGPNRAANEFLEVAVEPDGTLTIVDKTSGLRYEKCNLFQDGGDVGGEYEYSPPKCDKVIASPPSDLRISTVCDGPAQATFLIEGVLHLPRGARRDLAARMGASVPCPIRSHVTLAAGSRRVEIRTEFENRAKDHRLRVLFPLGCRANASHAESQFDVVERPVGPEHVEVGWIEDTPSIHPQQSFVSVSARGRGLTIANRGLPAYELLDDEQGTLALTLLRAVGVLARPSNTIRNAAGPMIPTPDAQVQRTLTFHYAIVPHAGDWRRAKAYVPAHEFKHPLRAFVAGAAGGRLAAEKGYLTLRPANMVLSAFCRDDQGRIVLRFYNTLDRAGQATIQLGFRVRRAWLANLAGEQRKAIRPDGRGVLRLRVGAKKIVNILLDA